MSAHVIGYGFNKPSIKSGAKVFDMILDSINLSFQSIRGVNNINKSHLNGIIGMPSLAEPKFMDAHYIATRMNLFPKLNFVAKTIDCGGASPVTALLEAKRLISTENFDLLAIVSGDAVSTLPSHTFLNRANQGFEDLISSNTNSQKPYIPHAYDRIAQWYIDQVCQRQIVVL